MIFGSHLMLSCAKCIRGNRKNFCCHYTEQPDDYHFQIIRKRGAKSADDPSNELQYYISKNDLEIVPELNPVCRSNSSVYKMTCTGTCCTPETKKLKHKHFFVSLKKGATYLQHHVKNETCMLGSTTELPNALLTPKINYHHRSSLHSEYKGEGEAPYITTKRRSTPKKVTKPKTPGKTREARAKSIEPSADINATETLWQIHLTHPVENTQHVEDSRPQPQAFHDFTEAGQLPSQLPQEEQPQANCTMQYIDTALLQILSNEDPQLSWYVPQQAKSIFDSTDVNSQPTEHQKTEIDYTSRLPPADNDSAHENPSLTSEAAHGNDIGPGLSTDLMQFDICDFDFPEAEEYNPFEEYMPY